MNKYIPVFKPEFKQEEKDEVLKVLDSGMLVCGKKVKELEEEFAEYVGSKYAIAVNSCTSALLLAYTTLNKNRSVYIPSITFVSVIHMAVKTGLHVTFDDRIPVGHAYRIGNTSIWDCAHELERDIFKNKSIRVGGKNDTIMCFSFYPTKNLGGAEGGMIAVDDKDLYDYFMKMRSHGMVREGYDWDYSVELSGYKCAMTDIQAAILLPRLKRLDDDLFERSAVVGMYNLNLSLSNQSLHVYPVLSKKRNKLMKELAKNNIGSSVHFKPCHLQPVFDKWDIKRWDLKKSEEWGETETSLPLYPSLTKEEVNRVCEIVKKYI